VLHAAQGGSLKLDAHIAGLLGRLFIFACLLTVAGLLGVVSSIGQIRSGRRNLFLNVARLMVIGIAVVSLVVGATVR
jgi:hypothetical protein